MMSQVQHTKQRFHRELRRRKVNSVIGIISNSSRQKSDSAKQRV